MSASRPDHLPEFERPPLVEVALALQFNAIPRLRGVEVGRFWSLPAIRDAYPRVEEANPLPPINEDPDLSPAAPHDVKLELLSMPPMPRFVFLNEAGTQALQLQEDRFTHNWRKVGEGDEYPRYESIREQFESELVELSRFVESEGLGQLVPNTCEVTYVNVVEIKGEENAHPLAAEIMAPLRLYETLGGAALEAIRFEARHLIRDESQKFRGRLHVLLQPSVRRKDGRPAYTLQLVARGAPSGDSIEAAMRFLDLGRDHLCRAFAEATTARMHETWGRTA